MLTKTIEEIKISDLTFLPDNPRQVKKGAIERLAKSLSSPRGKELFQKRPILVNERDGKLIVYAGNQRLRAAQSLGWETVPCIIDQISLSEEREETIKDNLVIGEWDDDILANNFDLKELEDWGMDLKELGIEPLGDDETDDVPEPPKESRSERGKVYQLGRHRIMCGDSTDAGDVALLMDGKKADMVFTDPPYGVSYDGGVMTKREKLIGDDTTGLYEPCCLMARDYTVEDAPLYLWHAGVKGIAAAAAAAAAAATAGYEIRCEIVWNKNHAQFGALSAQYKQKHEPCYYCFKKGHSARWKGPTNEVTVWDVDRAVKNEHHPTQKPVELALRAIKNHDVDSVLDLFLGSGSTLIACEQTGRICYGMEIDSKYIDVIIERFCNYTGQDKEEIYNASR